MKKSLVRVTTAFVGATAAALLVGAVINPATAAPTPTITATISSPTFRPGEKPVITVTENIAGARTFSLVDTSGASWTRTSNSSTGATFSTTAASDGTVTITMTRTADGAKARAQVAYKIERWPGHLPGRLILGMSCQKPCADDDAALGRPYGVHRQFEKWGNWSAVAADIDSSHAAGRLPWVSVKAPGGNAAGWRAVAAGGYDTAIGSLATVLKANDESRSS